jgi:hypothetical protein
MNKTLKTIAWICIALGILGTVVDAGLVIYGRSMLAQRQAAFEEIRSGNTEGSAVLPGRADICIAADKDKDGKPDGGCLDISKLNRLNLPGSNPALGGMMGGRFAGGPGSRLADRRMGGIAFLPLFFFALGPVLAIIGMVILLVNREPKKEPQVVEASTKPEAKTEKSKKKA